MGIICSILKKVIVVLKEEIRRMKGLAAYLQGGWLEETSIYDKGERGPDVGRGW